MTEGLLIASVVLSAACLLIVALLLFRRGPSDLSSLQTRLDLIEKGQDKAAQAVRDETSRGRSEAAESFRQLREEVINSVKSILDSVVKSIGEAGTQQAAKLDGFANHLSKTNEVNQENGRLLRADVTTSVQSFMDAALSQVKESAQGQRERLEAFAQRLDAMATKLDERLKDGQTRNDKHIGDMRAAMVESATRMKEDTAATLGSFREALVQQAEAAAAHQKGQLEVFASRLAEQSLATEQKLGALRETIEQRLASLQEANDKRLGEIRGEGKEAAHSTRAEITSALKTFQDSVQKQMTENAGSQRTQVGDLVGRLNAVVESNEKRMDGLRTAVEQRLKEIQEGNDKKLDQMRQTVDEKLEGTLERRLGESFKQVSERLELVHRGLGEMQTLASGVGDLKRVLTNVKTRGTWGEWQLGSLLEQMLTADQYEKNVATKPGSSERVEFAIKLPGRNGELDQPCWLPIDSKCPQEDYQRIIEASERGDGDGVREAVKQLDGRIKACAQDISEKYLCPPHTTDFGILFAPTEGLYAEILRCPGLQETLQRDYRVSVAGPTTLAALLNSLQMGFRTLVIEKRSSEVWNVLSAVKTEFGKFGEVFVKVRKKLTEATNTVDAVSTRTRAMERTLRDVELLPVPEAANLLGLVAAADDGTVDGVEEADPLQA